MKKRNIILAVIIIIFVALIVLLSMKKTLTPKNDEYFIGNTAGNLYGNGLFCEYDGKVYFSNPSASGSLYVMNPDETDAKKLAGVAIQSINVDSRRIYYALSGKSSGSGLGYIRKATGLFSIKRSGGDSLCYTQDAIGTAILIGNRIYFQHYEKNTGTYLDSIKTDKSDPRVYIRSMIDPSCADSGLIYYAGAPTDGDMYLHALDIRTGEDTVLYNRQMYQPIYDNGFVYYIDLETKYQLHRYNLLTGEDMTLTKEHVEMFNVGSGMIYYQTDSSSDDAALKRMTTEGTDIETVITGIYTDINMTSQFVYFHDYKGLYPMYHQSIRGNVNVWQFEPGI